MKKEVNTARSVHRIDLSLPIVQTDSYEIFCTVPSSLNFRTISRQKPLVDINKRSINPTSRIRSPARLKHLTGPVFVNLVVDMGPMVAESVSTIGDITSHPLIHSGYSNRSLKTVPPMNKRNKQKNIKDDGDRSRSSSSCNRLRYESLGSFDDYNINRTKNHNMWQNFHHRPLTSTKALHLRRTPKNVLASDDIQLKISSITSLDNLSQKSAASVNEQLCERIEQLTKAYFPEIQQIRHTRPCPELISNRIHLHREHKKKFMPILSRTRIF